jgi:hypothetical protein
MLAQLTQKAKWGMIIQRPSSVLHNFSHSHSILYLEPQNHICFHKSMLLSLGNTCIVFALHAWSTCLCKTHMNLLLAYPTQRGLCIIVITGAQSQLLLYWSYGSWIYNYLCNQFLSPLKFEFLSWRCVLDTTIYDRVSKWLAVGQWFCLRVLRFPPPIKLTVTIIEILLKVALSTITLTTIRSRQRRSLYVKEPLFFFLFIWTWNRKCHFSKNDIISSNFLYPIHFFRVLLFVSFLEK